MPDSPKLPLIDNGAAKVEARGAAKTSGPSRLFLIPLAMMFLFTGAVIGMYFQPPALRIFFGVTGLEPGGGTSAPIATPISRVLTDDDIAALETGVVVALGRLVPLGEVITVALPYSASDTRIETLPVRVGQWVEAGGILATLDNRTDLEAAVRAAQAEVDVAAAKLNQTRLSVAASKAEAEARLHLVEAAEATAKLDIDRTQSLFERGVATQAVLDRADLIYRQATQEVLQSRATVARFGSGSDLSQADIFLAERQRDAAIVQLSTTRDNLEKAILRAPSNGSVLHLHVRPGERPGAKGVLDFGNTREMTAEVEIYQNQINRIALGNVVRLRAEAFDDVLHGEVVEIGVEVGRQSIIDADPAANTDARVITVTVLLDHESSGIAGRFINLEVLAWFFDERVE